MLSFSLTPPSIKQASSLELDISQYVIGVFGNSGAGKSCLLKGVAGLQEGIVENVCYNKQNLSGKPINQSPIYYLDQQATLFPHLTVRQNLELAVTHGSFAKYASFNFENVVDWCQLDSILDKRPMLLSGGQAQKAAFAQSILSGKPIIMLDEPFSALDWQSREYFCQLIQFLHQKYQRRFILVSHSLKELALSANYIFYIKEFDIAKHGGSQQMVTYLSNKNGNNQLSQLTGNIIEINTRHKLVKLQLSAPSNQFIYIKSPKLLSDSLNIQVEAKKVSLSKTKPSLSTIVNCLECVVINLKVCESEVIVELDVDGQTLFADISQMSQEKLHFNSGDKVYAQFKAL
ncbi:ATP-binding cassette domain-containing protein [Colwellia sp. MEBiC06753]